MTENYVTLQRYQSAKKNVALIRYDGKKCILKQCPDETAVGREAETMRLMSHTGYAPNVIVKNINSIICEYIEGESFYDKYRLATMQDDSRMLQMLAKRLSIFLQLFHSVTQGKILGNLDFRNFILRNDMCVCVSYDSVKEGMPYGDVAAAIAFALTNTTGDYYAGFPFAATVLDCFHLGIMDVINELSEQLDRLPRGIVDKNMILDSLIDFEEKGMVWQIINNNGKK